MSNGFDFGHANAGQREAIETTEGPVLIIAAPGTGKTFTLVNRVVYLLSELKASPESIFVATFTEKADKEQVADQITELQVVERQFLTRMDSIQVSKAFTEEFLDAYTSLDRRISNLKDENDAFDTRNRLQTAKKEANDRYQKQVKSVLSKIEIAINTQMEAINDEVTGGEYNAPKLTLKGYNSYTFETPRDKGTGTNHRSMIIYDLAVLQNTVLPAIAYDSNMFYAMPRPDLSNLIRVYNDQVEKQIFIAVDKTSECTQGAQQILQETTVLKLDNNEQALFGEKWRRKDRR